MVEIRKTDVFDRWLRNLKDRQAVVKIAARIDRLAFGMPGDVKSVGAGLMEMRIDYGPGYRVYYLPRGAMYIILLCGGDKSSQARDIDRATKLALKHKDSE